MWLYLCQRFVSYPAPYFPRKAGKRGSKRSPILRVSRLPAAKIRQPGALENPSAPFLNWLSNKV